MTDSLLCRNSCGLYYFLLCFHETLIILKKKALKFGASKVLAFLSLQLCSTDCKQFKSAKVIEIGGVVHEIL